jgi:chemotaxis protein MotB
MQGRSFFIGLSVLLLFGSGAIGYLAWEWHQQLRSKEAELAAALDRLGHLEPALAAATSQLAEEQAAAAALRRDMGATREQIKALQQEKDAVAKIQKDLEREMQTALKSRDVTISQLKGRLSVDIVDRVLFDSGKAELKPEGREVLAKIADVLAQAPNRNVLVVGHTDGEPIRATRHLYDSNWELSTARATAAVRYLTEEAGVDPRRIGAAGYGEFRPVADNATPEGRARNRRITLVILGDEVLGPEL